MRDQVKTILYRYWPEGVAALAPILVFWRLVVGSQVLYWGLPLLQFVPWRVLVNEALRWGRLPLWTGLLGMGAPLMANHQSAVFYPPNWISLVVPAEVAISALAVLHLSFAGAGMVRLARRLGLSDFGCAVAGLSFSLCGYLTGRMWFITINNAIAWLPWIVLAATPPLFGAPGVAGGQSTRPAIRTLLVLSALISFQLLSGHAQSTFYTLLLAGAWTAWHSLYPSSPNAQSPIANLQSSRRRLPPAGAKFRPLIANLALLALALLFSFCLTAVQLIPTYELLRQSARAGAAEFDFVMTFSLWPWRLFTFVFPNLFGHPADHSYWGYASYWEDNAYLGLLPLAFAIYALLRFSLPRRRSENTTPDAGRAVSVNTVVNFSLLTLLISILFSFGQNTPIFPFFYRYVPGFNLFQAPARLLIGYTFALSLLAGVGAHGWQASDRKRYWSRLGIAGSLAMFVLGLTGASSIVDPKIRTFATALVWTAALAAVMFAILLVQPKTPVRWNGIALAFIAVDLGLAGIRATPAAGRALYTHSPAFEALEGRLFQSAEDEYEVKFGTFFRFQSFDPLDPQALRDSLLPNMAALSGIAAANNFDPLLPARYVNYARAMESSAALMDLADVRAVVGSKGLPSVRSGRPARMRVVYDAQTVPDPQTALAAISSPTFDPDALVILEPAPGDRLTGWALDPNRYSVTLSLDRPGYAVLSDTYYPGWRAFVDGSPQPAYIADYNFRAVAVPAGTHTVTFEYAPFSATLGLLVSAGALMVWAGLAVAAQKFIPARK